MRFSFLLVLLSAIVMTQLAAGQKSSAIGGPATEPSRFIVELQQGIDSAEAVDSVVADLEQEFSFVAGRVYHYAIKGFSAELSSTAATALSADSRVWVVEPDSKAEYAVSPAPNGVLRVGNVFNGAARIDGADEGYLAEFKVAVIDAGVDVDHPDLNVGGGYDATGDERNEFVCGPRPVPPWDDEDELSHGTNVAGVIGARDNGIGVLGVAPGVTIISVKGRGLRWTP